MRLRIERRGNTFTMLAGKPGEQLTPTGPATVTLKDPVYVGLAVCSHDANVLETAVFSNVSLQALPAPPRNRPPAQRYRSKISIFDLRDKSIRTLYQADTVFEAPNWSPDGKYLSGQFRRPPLSHPGGWPPGAAAGAHQYRYDVAAEQRPRAFARRQADRVFGILAGFPAIAGLSCQRRWLERRA